LFRATGCFTCAIGCAVDRSEWVREEDRCDGDTRSGVRLRLCVAAPERKSWSSRLAHLDLSDATFACPDLTKFCRLDELGLAVTGQRLRPDRAVLACRALEPDQWCRRCGCEGVPRDTVTRELAHEPLDRCRRRVQLAIHGHRGMKNDPLYSARRTLHTGAGLLTDKQAARLTALFADDAHVEVEARQPAPITQY
jgi:hypothetical protein